MIDKALPEVRAQDRALIQQGSDYIDRLRNQGADRAFVHSMRGAAVSEETALAQRNHFIVTTLNEARQLEADGQHDAALVKFGEAVHPEMDRTSPWHVDADGRPRVWMPASVGAAVHGVEESRAIPSADEMAAAAARMQAAYKYVFGGPK